MSLYNRVLKLEQAFPRPDPDEELTRRVDAALEALPDDELLAFVAVVKKKKAGEPISEAEQAEYDRIERHLLDNLFGDIG